MRGSRRWLAASVVLMLVAAACGGDAQEGATGRTVTSDDGRLTLTAPAGRTVTISSGNPADLPEGAAGFVIGPVYELGPDGATFDEPVLVTYAVEESELDEGHTPLLFVVDDAGNLEQLSDTSVTRAGGSVEISGSLSHFSALIALTAAATLSVTPTSARLMVGDSIDVLIVQRSRLEVQQVPDVDVRFQDESLVSTTPEIAIASSLAVETIGQAREDLSEDPFEEGSDNVQTSSIRQATGRVTCVAPGSGLVRYHAIIRVVRASDTEREDLGFVGADFAFLVLLPEIHTWAGSVFIEVECVGSDTGAGESTDATDEPSGDGGDADAVSYEVPIGDKVAHVELPQTIEPGEIQGEVCVIGPDGTLVGLIEWFFSWFPDSGEPSHTSFMIDGCGTWSMTILSGPPGSMWTSDGNEAVPFAEFAG